MSTSETIAPTKSDNFVYRTKEIVLKSGHKVKVFTELGARKHQALKHFTSKQMKLEGKQDGFKKDGSPKFTMTPSIDIDAMAELEVKTMEMYLESFNGESDNAYDRMMDVLSGEEYDEVWSAIEKTKEADEKK